MQNYIQFLIYKLIETHHHNYKQKYHLFPELSHKNQADKQP